MIKILGIDPSQKNLGLVKAQFAPQDGTLAIIDMKLVSTEKGSDTKQVRKSSDNLRRAQGIKLGRNIRVAFLIGHP